MIRIGEKRLSIQEVREIVDGAPFELDEGALRRSRANFEFLKDFAKDKVIYGINTGFGPMAQNRLQDEEIVEAQYNLIRSHAMGSGDPLSPGQVRSMMLARLNSLMKGYSGVSEELLQLLAEFLRKDIVPHIPEHGGVGASGDLVQLAHLGLALIGEGRVLVDGTWRDAAKAFEEKDLAPLRIRMREGLAILNGTSTMVGVGTLNLVAARRALDRCLSFSAIINDLLGSYDDHFSEGLNRVRKHEGQQRVAERMRAFLGDSQKIRGRADELYRKKVEEEVLEEKVQEYYSIRCVPQILGPIYDTLDRSEAVLLDELDSVTDNPVIDHEAENVFHGGNFHGEQISVEMDKLKAGLTKASMLAERQLNYLLNDRLNGRFPPFLNKGKPGLNFGLQGAQYTATSTVAENQSLSYPVHLHSIPSNKDNQDIVSMGTNAALGAERVLRNLYEVLAVEALALVQASDLLENEEKLSSASKKELEELKNFAAPFVEDEARYAALSELSSFLASSDPDI